MKSMNEGIRPDGTVEGHVVETHYQACECIVPDDEGEFLCVISDGPGYNVETRVRYKTLLQAGFKREAASR